MDYLAAKAFILSKLEKELSEDLFYHGKHHTLDVLDIAKELCISENIGPYDTILVKTAALYHDAGFTISNVDHETLGCQIAKTTLKDFYYTDGEIDVICGMIMATKIPQSPKTHLEEIICDADLDYLGRDDFYPIGNTLFKELQAYNIIKEEEAWNKIQVSFLEAHKFWTLTTKTRREKIKQQYLQELKNLVATYE